MPQPGPGDIIGPAFRYRQPPGKIVREPGVKACGERQPSASADSAHSVTDRPLGRDMDCVRLYSLEAALYIARSEKCEPYFRIARHRQCPKLTWAKKFELRSKRGRLARDMAQGANNAIDLWMPGVGGDQNLHAFKPLQPLAAGVSWPTRPRDRYESR